MPRATGRKAFCGVGGESTWGTDGTVDRWFHLKEFSGGEEIAIVDQPSLYHAASSTNMRYSSLGPSTCDLSMTLIPTYTGFGTILQAALGVLATTGAGPYVHVYSLTTSETTSLTVEIATGDTGDSDSYVGFVPSSWEFSCEAGSANYALFMVKGLAKKRLSRGTASTPTFTGAGTPTPVLYWQSGSLSWNSVSYQPKSVKFSGDHGYSRVDELGSQYTAQQCRDKFGQYTASMVLECTNAQYAALYTAQLAGTAADLTITFTSGSTSMLWTLHNAILTSLSKPIQGAGKISITATWKGFSDGTDEGVTVSVTNAQSSGLAV